MAVYNLENSNALLLYKVGPVLVCSPTLPIESVVVPPHLTSMPGVNEAEPGVFKSIYGMVQVVDLRVRFGVDQVDRKSPGQIVIAEVAGGHAGFWVDQIEDVISFPEKGWSQLPSHVPNAVFGRALLQGDDIRLYTDFENLHKFKSSGYLRRHIERLKEKEKSQKKAEGRSPGESARLTAVHKTIDKHAENFSSATRQKISPTHKAFTTHPGNGALNLSTSGKTAVYPEKDMGEISRPVTDKREIDKSFADKSSSAQPVRPSAGTATAQLSSTARATNKNTALSDQKHPDTEYSSKRDIHNPLDEKSLLSKADQSVRSLSDSLEKKPLTSSLSQNKSHLTSTDNHSFSSNSKQDESKKPVDKPGSSAAAFWWGLSFFVLVIVAVFYFLQQSLQTPDAEFNRALVFSDKLDDTHKASMVDKTDLTDDTVDEEIAEQNNNFQFKNQLGNNASSVEIETSVAGVTIVINEYEEEVPVDVQGTASSAVLEESLPELQLESLDKKQSSAESAVVKEIVSTQSVDAATNDVVSQVDDSEKQGITGEAEITDVKISHASPEQSELPVESAQQSSEKLLSTKESSNSSNLSAEAQSQNIKQSNEVEKTKSTIHIHMVVKGDTLWDIAERYVHNPWRYPELARLSQIKNPDLIYPGQRVTIVLNHKAP